MARIELSKFMYGYYNQVYILSKSISISFSKSSKLQNDSSLAALVLLIPAALAGYYLFFVRREVFVVDSFNPDGSESSATVDAMEFERVYTKADLNKTQFKEMLKSGSIPEEDWVDILFYDANDLVEGVIAKLKNGSYCLVKSKASTTIMERFLDRNPSISSFSQSISESVSQRFSQSLEMMKFKQVQTDDMFTSDERLDTAPDNSAQDNNNNVDEDTIHLEVKEEEEGL